MSTTVTIAWIPIIKDAESSSALAELKALKDQKLAVAGLEHAYHGAATDPNEPKAIEIVDVWSSPDAAKAAAESPQAAAMKKLLEEILDKSNPEARPVHNLFTLTGDFVKVAEAPVTQFAVTFVPPASATDFEAAFNEVVKACGSPDGFVAGAHGWGAEEVDHPKAGKVKAFLSTSGWVSEEKAKAGGAGAQKTFEPLRKFTDHHHLRTTILTKDK
ncbi:hypothetical protein KVR01_004390 [Diaporthe batatas]|uniref:uncharacterized protein n=1 Tax=Diaporthe batatas TaxID=748121 RepID=UPI001D039E10|nr:uncharacterized protein KVR01_004390 [Diaporthe batatas]KAG8165838.1 hypothetical protein KVR01_004390 [Diaporthe batatas]